MSSFSRRAFFSIFTTLIITISIFAGTAQAARFMPNVLAGKSEKVRVIKFDLKNNDTIVERKNGERLLLQNHYTCNSMSTEYPAKIIWNTQGDVVKLKVDFNEICKVYRWGKYSGEAKLTKRILTDNIIETEHEAELIWKGIKYRVDYGDGCRNLRKFVGKNIQVQQGRFGWYQ